MYIDNIVIEITRRCNMTCPHCLRGDAENVTISDKILDRFFFKNRGNDIGTLTFTGGEPSLAPSRIQTVIRYARMYHVTFNQFYMVTNAKKLSRVFISALLDLYQACGSPEDSYVNYSNDKFHRFVDGYEVGSVPLDVRKLEVFNFFKGGKDNEKYPLDWFNLLDEGRSREDSLGSREVNLHPYTVEEDRVTDESLYLNALGKILPSCDLSYESQRHPSLILGDVFDDDFNLLEYAKRWNRRIETVRARRGNDETTVSEVVEIVFEPNGEVDDSRNITVKEIKEAA